jgi:hypothetical protein
VARAASISARRGADRKDEEGSATVLREPTASSCFRKGVAMFWALLFGVFAMMFAGILGWG